MANFTVYLGASDGGHPSKKDVAGDYVVDKVVDFTTATLATTRTSISSYATSDTFDVFVIPANTFVLRTGVNVTTAASSGTTGIVTLSLVSPSTALLGTVSLNATGYTWGSATATATAATTIRATLQLDKAGGAVWRALAHLLDVSNLNTVSN